MPDSGAEIGPMAAVSLKIRKLCTNKPSFMEDKQQTPPPGDDFTKKVEEKFEELKGEANKHWEKFE